MSSSAFFSSLITKYWCQWYLFFTLFAFNFESSLSRKKEHVSRFVFINYIDTLNLIFLTFFNCTKSDWTWFFMFLFKLRLNSSSSLIFYETQVFLLKNLFSELSLLLSYINFIDNVFICFLIFFSFTHVFSFLTFWIFSNFSVFRWHLFRWSKCLCFFFHR